eukprot:8066439-Lingulodinium_polyedra.AAC.1
MMGCVSGRISEQPPRENRPDTPSTTHSINTTLRASQFAHVTHAPPYRGTRKERANRNSQRKLQHRNAALETTKYARARSIANARSAYERDQSPDTAFHRENKRQLTNALNKC